MRLTDAQLGDIDVLGYTILPADAMSELVAAAAEECLAALASVYGVRSDQVHPAELARCYLPVMSPAVPSSLTAAQDELLVRSAEAHLGGPVIVKPAKVSVFAGPNGWHRDNRHDLPGLKWVAYLGPDAVRFLVVPGSHRQGADSHDSDSIGDLEVAPIELAPCQLLAFDIRVLHASDDAAVRTQWSVSYLAAPEGPDEIDVVVDHLGEFLRKQLAYPTAQYPYFPPTWEDGSDPCLLAATLHSSGVLERYLEVYGAGR